MLFWDEFERSQNGQAERKKKFLKIGEDVFSFFMDKATDAGFEEREGQWEMSCEIVEGLRDKKHVIVEAGVGIGKSFAYIVPILYYIKTYRRPVVIATSTIALQEQLTGDIDKIMDMLNYDVEVLIAKGQNHFLCKNRLEECFTREFLEEKEEHQIIYNTVRKFGKEKSDWNIAIPDAIWNRINVKEYKAQFCRDKCSYRDSCHYYDLRQKMMYTHGIIVCNQDLLAVNMHKRASLRRQLMSEDIGIIVVDEAHNLESKVRSSVTSYITLSKLKDAMLAAGKAVNAYDNEFNKELENAESLANNVFKSLLKQMDEQDKEAEKRGQDVDRYYVKMIGAECKKLTRLLEDISFKASMAFGDFTGDRHRKNYDEELEQLEDYVQFFESLNKENSSNDIFWMERDRELRGVKWIRLYSCPKEVDRIIVYIVEAVKNDRVRYRIYIDIILFDTLNQLFGGKNGAGNLIFEVYERLEDFLSDSMHYWLQRAKSIYRLKANDIKKLKEAYTYSIKAYFDGGTAIKSKAALTSSLISCLIYGLETDKDEKKYYLEQAIELGYEAVNSDYYRFNMSYLNNELKQRKRLNSYELMKNICNEYIEYYCEPYTLEKAKKLVEKLESMEAQFAQKHRNSVSKA